MAPCRKLPNRRTVSEEMLVFTPPPLPPSPNPPIPHPAVVSASAKLPLEVIRQIASYHIGDRTSLIGANGVNSLWNAAVRPHLFYTVKLRPYTLSKFEEFLKNTPRAEYWIRYLEFYMFRPWSGGDPLSDPMISKWKQLGRILQTHTFKHLGKVVFCHCIFPNDDLLDAGGGKIIDTFTGFSNIPSIQILHYEDVFMDAPCFKTILRSLPNTLTLHVVRSKFHIPWQADSDSDEDAEDTTNSDSDSSSENDSAMVASDGDHDEKRLRRAGIGVLSLSNVEGVKRLFRPSDLSKVTSLDIDGVCFEHPDLGNPSEDITYLLEHVASSVKTLRCRLLPYGAYSVYYDGVVH